MAKTNKNMSGKELLEKAAKKEREESEDEKEEEGGEYEMPRSEAVSEHERLIKVLRSGNKTAQLAEAILQEKELRKIKNATQKRKEQEND